MWKQKYMLKNLLFFLVPLMVPILILGTFSIIITQHFIKNDLNQKNSNLLSQTRDHLEVILNEMDTLSLSYQTNHNISVRLKAILNAEQLEYEQILELKLLNNFLGSPANARPYIHSIYVYYDNPGVQFLTSSEGIASLHNFYDVDWYQAYVTGNENDSWIEERNIDQYGIEQTRVITMYRKLYTPGLKETNGILVLNILPSYIERLLQELLLSPEQTILITDEQQRILFQSNKTPELLISDIVKMTSDTYSQINIQANDQAYRTFQLQSERHQLHYISLIPENVLYRVPQLLRMVTFILLIISFLIGIMITYVLTRRNYNNLKSIESIISAAKRGQPYPIELSKVTDEYGFILQKIIRSFVEKNYLKTQLSKRSYALKYMEMLALQSQINPHFLYNTLEVIYWKTLGLTGKPNDASTMIEHLSDVLKYALGDPKHTVLLDKEIRYTEIYLEIQKTRNKDKLNVIWEVEEATKHHKVLKLILQPLIENCIYHGIKEKKGISTIKIKIRVLSSFLWIRVIDNGKGMTAERLRIVREMLAAKNSSHQDDEEFPASEHSGHIGLYNTNKRLKLSYGNQHSLRICSKLDWGTLVEMAIPINEHISQP